MKKYNPDLMILAVDENRGIYAPQQFINYYGGSLICSDNDYNVIDLTLAKDDIISGPDHEFYWDSWDDIINNCHIIDNGEKYRIYQNGDIWLIPEDMEIPEDF